MGKNQKQKISTYLKAEDDVKQKQRAKRVEKEKKEKKKERTRRKRKENKKKNNKINKILSYSNGKNIEKNHS